MYVFFIEYNQDFIHCVFIFNNIFIIILCKLLFKTIHCNMKINLALNYIILRK